MKTVTDQDDVEEVNSAVARIRPYKDRSRKLHPSAAFTSNDLWYDYLINDWIVNEPDWEELMKLFMRVHFHPGLFVGFVVHGIDFWKHQFIDKMLSNTGFALES